jgi:hypothetical protein
MTYTATDADRANEIVEALTEASRHLLDAMGELNVATEIAENDPRPFAGYDFRDALGAARLLHMAVVQRQAWRHIADVRQAQRQED